MWLTRSHRGEHHLQSQMDYLYAYIFRIWSYFQISDYWRLEKQSEFVTRAKQTP
jgi:hypothetical protein